MQQHENLYLIGTSHIAKQSIKEIELAFKEIHPDVCAIEFDQQRYHALMSNVQGKASMKDIPKIGFNGYLFARIGSWASKKLGKMVGVSPGSEMKKAIHLSKEHKAQLLFIDQPIHITLKRLSKALTWREKFTFIKDLFMPKRQVIDFDLSAVPNKQTIKKMVGEVKKSYPSLYKVLIEERNYCMARNLKAFMSRFPEKKILAIVGAGHEEDIITILKDNQEITYSFSVSA